LSFSLISLLSHKTARHQKNIQAAKRQPRGRRAETARVTWVARALFSIPPAYAVFAQNRQHLLREQLFNILFFLSYILNLLFNYTNVALKAETIHFSPDFSGTPFTVKSTSETLVSAGAMFK